MRNVNEVIERHSLTRLIKPELQVDKFKSKMGDDADVIVISVNIAGKEPALDVVDFLEKGYEWILDADTSAGELDDGTYLVFAELGRDKDAPDNIIKIVTALQNLADIPVTDWQFTYHRNVSRHDVSRDNLIREIPLSREAYNDKHNKQESGDDSMDKLRVAAGVKVNTKAVVNEYTDSLRIAAGLK
jgi:hypothetical protein